MINPGNPQVQDLQWSQDGTLISILYTDGAVLQGTVGGVRAWKKSYANVGAVALQWSASDTGVLLLFTVQLEIYQIDPNGDILVRIR